MADLIIYEGNQPMLNEDTERLIAEFEKKIKWMKAEEEKLKQAIQEEMERKQIRGIKTDKLTISYVAETYTEYFDKERFREDYPNTYDDYVKIKPKKAFVKIGVK